MTKRIAFVKTGWSDSYQGEEVVGRHAHILIYKEAHERFNFLRANDGWFYGYLPPIGPKRRPPQPQEKNGWLVIFVAARHGNGPLTIVGWYKNAMFESDYVDRPEYKSPHSFQTDVDGNNYRYCVSADNGYLLPTSDRLTIVSGDHFKRTPVIYVKGNGRPVDGWQNELAKLAEKIVQSGESRKPKENPWLTFPDQQHRDKVERAAINEAKKFLESKQYEITDRQKDNCGYDLLAKRKKPRLELHVEVKGTSGEAMRFFMSRKERHYMSNPKWRLLIVTNALNEPRARLMKESEVIRTFQFISYAWEATRK